MGFWSVYSQRPHILVHCLQSTQGQCSIGGVLYCSIGGCTVLQYRGCTVLQYTLLSMYNLGALYYMLEDILQYTEQVQSSGTEPKCSEVV